jgi:type II secretory pathway pseudopilin PulG
MSTGGHQAGSIMCGRRRRGIFLIEILFVLFFIGAVAIVAMRLFVADLRIIRQAEAQQDRTTLLEQQIAAIRADVWSAATVDVVGDGTRLTIHDGQNRMIQWELGPERVARSTDDRSTPPRTWPATTFPIRAERDAAGVTLSWDEHNGGGTTRVRLPSQIMMSTGGGR